MKFNYSLTKFSVPAAIFISIFLIFIFTSTANSTTRIINVTSNLFTPDNVTANVGDSIKWQWIDGVHNTTSGIIPSGAASWVGSLDAGNPVFIYVITVAGTYNFECTFHPGMMGMITASGGSSSVLLTENFDYPAGDSLGAHGWVWINSAINILMVTAPGLEFPGYPLSNIGNATTLQNTGEDSYKSMSSADSTGSLYVSFMVNITAAQAAGDYFLALLPPTSTTNYTARFYARDSAGLRFGISKSTAGAGGIFLTSNSYNIGTTYLIVVKYTFNPGSTNDDEISFYVFSSGVPSTEPATPTVGPVTGTATDNALGRVALRQGTATNAPTLRIDGIRAATNWSDISTSVQNISSTIADNFYLSQNYPNPFNPNTTVKFNIPDKGYVNLTVYNSLGEVVRTMVNENLNSGSYSSNFNGSDLNSGVYFYRLTFSADNGNSFVETKKLILLK